MARLRGKWLENVDRTHPVLASGKLVQQQQNFSPMPVVAQVVKPS